MMVLKQSPHVPPKRQKPGLWWRTCAMAFASCPRCSMSISFVHEDVVDGEVQLDCLSIFLGEQCSFNQKVKLKGWT